VTDFPSPYQRSDFVGLESLLPPGFSRSYTYLTTRPEDLRLVDLEPLLDEYKLLVQTTEVLLAERAHAQKELRRATAFTARQDYYRRICQVDASLDEDRDVEIM
jgi:hypothetical protein